MNKLSVKQQLGLAFGALVALVLLVSLLGLRALGRADEQFSGYVDQEARRAQLVSAIRDAVNARAIAARNLVLVTTAQDRQIEQARVTQTHETVQSTLRQLQAAVGAGREAGSATDRDQALVAEITRVEAAYGPLALAIVQLALDDRREEAITKMNAECRPLLAALVKASTDYLEHSHAQAGERIEASQRSYATQRMLLLAVSLAAALAAAALGWRITRRLVAALGAEPA